MRKISFIIIIAVLFSVSFIFADKINSLELKKGKNEIYFNSTNIYVRDFVKNNPEIESVSYDNGNTSYGFVNVFGGIGKNFALEENKSYEIISKENITIYLK